MYRRIFVFQKTQLFIFYRSNDISKKKKVSLSSLLQSQHSKFLVHILHAVTSKEINEFDQFLLRLEDRLSYLRQLFTDFLESFLWYTGPGKNVAFCKVS